MDLFLILLYKGDYMKIKRFIITIVILIACSIIFCYQNTSNYRLANLYDVNIEIVKIGNDEDNDGIDDQLDILQGAIDYINTNPKYKSKYYQNGYTDDGYGTCTDVVAYAFKNAGYDLRELVDEDIHKYPDDYDIVIIDKNIDFRRVKNLEIFFKHNALSLTTDIADITSWQAGDVVIFDNHIGIVSDRRNRKGIPYIIHHSGPWQRSYEEDVLEKYKVIGHYRIK